MTLSLRADGDDAVITVGDDGPGIPEAQRERIFDRFARVDADRRQGSGAGLGLAIVREIVRAHDGSVVVAERTGGGVDFVVRLPMRRPRISLRRTKALLSPPAADSRLRARFRWMTPRTAGRCAGGGSRCTPR